MRALLRRLAFWRRPDRPEVKPDLKAVDEADTVIRNVNGRIRNLQMQASVLSRSGSETAPME